MKPILGITIGDFNGIGPEVALKAIISPEVKKICSPILIGSVELFSHYSKIFKISKKIIPISKTEEGLNCNGLPCINIYDGNVKQLQIGRPSPDAGVCAGKSIEEAVKLTSAKQIDGFITSPTSKESLHYAGYNFPGQTEMIAMLSRSEKVIMILSSPNMRVGLVTVHYPISEISSLITQQRILEKSETFAKSLQEDYGITNPKIAVLGLNPHSGENGAIGMEEKKIIAPSIELIKQKGINISGPFSADGFFATYKKENYDGILAMYHDQGLIPFKMTEFEKGVNFSAGMKIIRTSPDHGTAYNIAGKGVANFQSMISAIQLAATIAQNRNSK